MILNKLSRRNLNRPKQNKQPVLPALYRYKNHRRYTARSVLVPKPQINQSSKMSSMNQRLGRGEPGFPHLSGMFTVVIYSSSRLSPFAPLSLCHRYWDQWSSEPDNHQSGGEHGEDCATLDSHSKTWFDVPCDHIYKRICQMDAIQLNWSLIPLKILQSWRVWILHRVVTENPKMNGYMLGITENKTCVCTPKGHFCDIKHVHRRYCCMLLKV